MEDVAEARHAMGDGSPGDGVDPIPPVEVQDGVAPTADAA